MYNLSGKMHKYKRGDKVFIRPMSRTEKDAYGPGWHPNMDRYEGQTLEIIACIGQTRYRLNDKERWTWAETNLELAPVYQPY